MSRLRFNGVAGVLASDLTDTATTIDLLAKLVYAGGDIPTITAPDYLPLSLLGDGGLVVEVVHLTAYTTGGVTGTIVRAQEGSPASAHLTGTVVVHAPTAADLDNLLEPNDLSDATPQAGAATTGVPGTSGDVARADHRHQVTPAGIGALALTGGTLTGQVIVPAPSAAQHVPRLARTPNAATGDLGMPGYVGSDTGWRDVSTSLINGWTGTLWVRRIRHRVHLRATLTAPGGQTAFLPTNWAANGFQCEHWGRRMLIASKNDTSSVAYTVQFSYSYGQFLHAAPPAGRQFSLAADHDSDLTRQTFWPTSLPGTQVTAPASWS